MIHFLYSCGIRLYGTTIRGASLFNPKARVWLKGRNQLFERIKTALATPELKRNSRKMVWFHCASLGEFEQGRPVMEAFREKYPDYLVFLTFFSPSGYEIRKAYPGADFVFYLPLDTARNARRFLDLVRPDAAFFVKYEFWFNFLSQLESRKIPTFLFSANFRPDQYFFRWYGDWSRRMLKNIDHIFVQTQFSKDLLEFVGITNVSVSGDTRFDRVSAISSNARKFPLIEEFIGNKPVLLAGSTWPDDEDLLAQILGKKFPGTKVIIAPHETDPKHIDMVHDLFGNGMIRYSDARAGIMNKYDYLVIDSIGILSNLYQYASVAYIGGGFGAGIHNILEAATFGLPVIFGPNYHKFTEARKLIELGGAFAIHNEEDLTRVVTHMFSDEKLRLKAAGISRKFVQDRCGATDKILEDTMKFLSI
jgi:3-deoxy-D-manno-octulosonic-acid transferase